MAKKITDPFPKMVERHVLEMRGDGTARIHLTHPMSADSPEGLRVIRAFKAFAEQVSAPQDSGPLLPHPAPGRWYCSVGEGGIFEIGSRL